VYRLVLVGYSMYTGVHGLGRVYLQTGIQGGIYRGGGYQEAYREAYREV